MKKSHIRVNIIGLLILIIMLAASIFTDHEVQNIPSSVPADTVDVAIDMVATQSKQIFTVDSSGVVKHYSMPPGFYLEKSISGKYRPCRNGSALLWVLADYTQSGAIKRAWEQYDYEKEVEAEKWIKVKGE